MKHFTKPDGSLHSFDDEYEGPQITEDMQPLSEKEYRKRSAQAEPVKTYADLRRAEYPPLEDAIDALGKGIDGPEWLAYVAKRQAIKAKYPKG